MSPSRCRVCGAAAIRSSGVVEYFEGLPCEIFDCDACGCRWSGHDRQIHAQLHRTPAISYYIGYRRLLDDCRQLFREGDAARLRERLSAETKYRFVLDRLGQLDARSRILEWGCSLGYLTAPSILAGRDVVGVDVSGDAVAMAREAFGDHFVKTDSPSIEARAPYDAIYHVGLIGCVDDPIALTRRLLSLLREGGRLFFNAPNRDALFQRRQLWFDSAPPPELITLFPPGFWRRMFQGEATVSETIRMTSGAESTIRTLTRHFGPAWKAPVPHATESAGSHRWSQPAPALAWRITEAAVAKAAHTVGFSLGAVPEEYGYFVEIVKP